MALPFQQTPLQVVQGGGLDNENVILERLKEHSDQDYKNILYAFRMVLANYLDLTTDGNTKTPAAVDGRYNDILNKRWEEGRHNAIQNNTLIQVKSLVFEDPDIKWSGCTGKHPELTAEVRRQYYLKKWREDGWDYLYRQKILDLLCCGMGNVQAGVRDGKPFLEWVDALNVTWDTAHKDPKKKRFVFIDKPMPLADAIAFYPVLEKKFMGLRKDGTGGEQQVILTFYWSKTTTAVFYKKSALDGPKENPYGRIPVTLTTLIHLPSAKYAAGMVETQIGSHKLDLRLQRYFREMVIRGVPVGVLTGAGWDEESIDDLMDGLEGTVLRNQSKDAAYQIVNAPEIPVSALKLKEIVGQQLNAESGVNDFMRSQTDTQVDFASQLAYIAQESGVQGKFTAQVHQEGLKEDARLFMEIAAKFENGPVTLPINGQDMIFSTGDPQAVGPIGPLLGTDGEVNLKPMEYKSPAQKLQETMILGNVLALGNELAPPLRIMFWDQCLTAAEVENKDDLIQQLQQLQQAQDAQQAQMAQAQMMQGQQAQPGLAPA